MILLKGLNKNRKDKKNTEKQKFLLLIWTV